MKKYDLLSIAGGMLAVATILITAVLSGSTDLSPDFLAVLFCFGIFGGFIICLGGFAGAEYHKLKARARTYASR